MAGGVVGPKGAGDRHRAWGFAAYMRHQILGKTQVSVRLSIATLATLLFVLAFGLQAPVYADDPDEADPVEDCFGRVLSADPLHCHVLEEAHNAGIIEVDAIYGVARGLFIYLTQDDSLGSDSLDYLRRTAQEEARRTGEHECVFDPYGCGSGVLSTGKGYVLPESSVYQDIQLLPGGAEARRSYGGWQAFRELWPGAPAVRGGGGGGQVRILGAMVSTFRT